MAYRRCRALNKNTEKRQIQYSDGGSKDLGLLVEHAISGGASSKVPQYTLM